MRVKDSEGGWRGEEYEGRKRPSCVVLYHAVSYRLVGRSQ
jgi:hypothetical protein